MHFLAPPSRTDPPCTHLFRWFFSSVLRVVSLPLSGAHLAYSVRSRRVTNVTLVDLYNSTTYAQKTLSGSDSAHSRKRLRYATRKRRTEDARRKTYTMYRVPHLSPCASETRECVSPVTVPSRLPYVRT